MINNLNVRGNTALKRLKMCYSFYLSFFLVVRAIYVTFQLEIVSIVIIMLNLEEADQDIKYYFSQFRLYPMVKFGRIIA